MSSEIADFVAFLDKERNDSPHTVKAYARDVADFTAFCTAYYGGAWSFAANASRVATMLTGSVSTEALSPTTLPCRMTASKCVGP